MICSKKIKTILACRNEVLGVRAASELSTLGFDAEYRHLDISETSSILQFAEDVDKDFGNIDILVNNAAIAFKGSDPTPFKEQALPTIKTNFFGTLELTKALLPTLGRSVCPRIVNVASESGHLRIIKSNKIKAEFTSENLTLSKLETLMKQFVADVENETHTDRGWPDSCYGMSKLGVIAMTRILAREQPSMRINCCCPGYCSTDMTSHKGLRSAEQGALTPVMLALQEDSNGPTGKFFSDNVEIEW